MPKKARIKLQTKKYKQKGKRGGKGKQAKESDQVTKDLPAENGETKNEESPASDEAGEKEVPSLMNLIYHVLPVVPVSLRMQTKRFCKCKFSVAFRNIFKKEGISPHPIF